MKGIDGDPITATVNQFAALSGLGRTSIYELIKSGDIQSVTIGRRRLIVLESYRALLRSRLPAPVCHEPARSDRPIDGSVVDMVSNPLETNGPRRT
jgi:excisionase family DNA binding protein